MFYSPPGHGGSNRTAESQKTKCSAADKSVLGEQFRQLVPGEHIRAFSPTAMPVIAGDLVPFPP
jgi:hypothetical protein